MTYRDPSDEYDECPRCGDEYRVTRASDDICPECREGDEADERDAYEAETLRRFGEWGQM